MKIKNNRGAVGIDISIAIVIVFIFVSLIAILSYNINSTSREVELKSEATQIAVDEIETIKSEAQSYFNGNIENISNEEIEGKKGFFKTITIKDYTELEGNEDKISEVMKIATVKISYKFKGEIQEIELKTILTKEN